ncbi:MAG: hypothetical protein R2772_02770 [Chitinophagales bacterium]
MKNILLLVMVIFFYSCKENVKELNIEEVNEEQLKAPEIDMAMVGIWYSNVLDIVFDFDSDSAKQIVVLKKDFPEKLGIAEVEAIYKEDGSFSSSYFGLDGTILQTEEGTWYAKGDSLYIAYFSEGIEKTFAYHYEVKELEGVFTSLMDWDQDGSKDDRLILKSLKQGN